MKENNYLISKFDEYEDAIEKKKAKINECTKLLNEDKINIKNLEEEFRINKIEWEKEKNELELTSKEDKEIVKKFEEENNNLKKEFEKFREEYRNEDIKSHGYKSKNEMLKKENGNFIDKNRGFEKRFKGFGE